MMMNCNSMAVSFHLLSKTRVVQRMLERHFVAGSSPKYSFEGYLMDYNSYSFLLLTHYLFRLVSTNKLKWSCLPSDLSAINFVLRHLRYMLTHLDEGEIKDYALNHLFYKVYE